MTTFDDRENAFEAEFAHDQETAFRIVARRNRLLGLWAAQKLGLAQNEYDAYAQRVLFSDFERPGDDDVLERVQKDFEKSGVKISPAEIRKEMNRLLQAARDQIMNAPPEQS